MFRLPFLFIITGIVSFAAFHVLSLISLGTWMLEPPRSPDGWFRAHLLVLDWATMIAMGAVYQLMDVILQRRIHSVKLGYVHYAFFTAGSIVLLSGFLLMKPLLIGIGAVMAVIGVFLFAWNVGRTLWAAKQWNAVTVSTACAVGYLVLTGTAGTIMGLNFVFPLWWEGHERLFGAHIWMGTVGWFGLLITGFSYKMLSMFYLSHGAPAKLQKAVIVLWNAGVLLGAGSFLLGGGTLFNGIAIIVILLALIVYAVHLEQIKKKRHKSSPGRGVWWTIVCTRALIVFGALLILLWVMFPEVLWNSKITVVAGWMYLWGWVAMTILGYMSKIVPFLWWTYKYGPHAGKPNVPVMGDLISEKHVGYGMAGIAAGLLLTLGGFVFEVDVTVWAGGILLSLFSLYYMTLVGRVFTR